MGQILWIDKYTSNIIEIVMFTFIDIHNSQEETYNLETKLKS